MGIVVIEFLMLDGVMQAPGGKARTRVAGFRPAVGSWTTTTSTTLPAGRS